jgi:hypothetical protein
MAKLRRCPYCDRKTLWFGPRGVVGWCEHCHRLSELPQRTRGINRRRFLQGLATGTSITGLSVINIAGFLKRSLSPAPVQDCRGGATATISASGTVVVTPPTGHVEIRGFAPTVRLFPKNGEHGKPRPSQNASMIVRRARWRARVHPKTTINARFGRLRWNQLEFPNAPERWIS